MNKRPIESGGCDEALILQCEKKDVHGGVFEERISVSMVAAVLEDRQGAVDLLDENKAGYLVGKGERREA